MAAGDLVTLPGHIQFGDLLLGPGTAFGWQSLAGWEDSPALDSGTVNRADAHGAYPGRLLAQPRTVTLDGVVIRTDPGQMSTVVRALSGATALRDDELPLVIRLDGDEPLLCWARCLRRAVPVGTGGYAVGVVTGAAMQFEATDPRRYSLVEQRAETRLPTAEPGLDWNSNDAAQQLPAAQAAGAASAAGSFWAMSGLTLGSSSGAITATVAAASAGLAWTSGPGSFSGFPVTAGQTATFLADIAPPGTSLVLHWLDDTGAYVAGTDGVQGSVSGTAPVGTAQVRPVMRWASVPVPATVTIGPSRLLIPGPAEGLAWPLDFGAPGSTGQLVAVNSGDAPTHPLIEFRGPVSLPSLTNVSTGDAVEYDIDLAGDDVLLVDTGSGTVVLNGTASRLYTVTSRSVPEQLFTFSPGTTQLAFRAAPGSSDSRASAVVRYRSAYW